MEKLKGLFDKVAFDQNVARGCSWWLIFGFLLKENPNSTLISPDLVGNTTIHFCSGSLEETKKHQEKINSLISPNCIKVVYHTGSFRACKDQKAKEKYMENRGLEEKKNALIRTEKTLKKFFKKVELIRGKHYPCKIRCSREFPYKYEFSKKDHFILEGPQKNLYEEAKKLYGKKDMDHPDLTKYLKDNLGYKKSI
jgi:hypothetical protein